MPRIIEVRIIMKEEVSTDEMLPDIEQMAEQIKDQLYDTDPHNTYVEDVTYEVKYVSPE